jgi:hypothetical protein
MLCVVHTSAHSPCTFATLLEHPAVLVGGEAGLRGGEIIALEWPNVDLQRRQLCVAQSEWRGHVSMPKGGRIRYVPLTRRLAEALQQARHLRSPRVLCDREGASVTLKQVQVALRRAAIRAHVRAGIHILRHTFCSHLAMRGAPARAIQELAGHQNVSTTQRYMHLSPAALGCHPAPGDGHGGAGLRCGEIEEAPGADGLITGSNTTRAKRRDLEAPGIDSNAEAEGRRRRADYGVDTTRTK